MGVLIVEKNQYMSDAAECFSPNPVPCTSSPDKATGPRLVTATEAFVSHYGEMCWSRDFQG